MKILKWFVILIIAIPVLFMAGAVIRNKVVGPDGWAQDNTTERLKARMKDPDSMVIRASYIVRRQEPGTKRIIIAICGLVDGKNGFGGYTGGTRFMSRSVDNQDLGTFDTGEVALEDPQDKSVADSVHRLSAFEEIYWNADCVDAVHPALQPAK